MIQQVKKFKLPIIIIIIYSLLLIFRTEIAVSAFNNSLYYLKEMFEILPVIFLLTVAIEVLIPKEWIIKRFGDRSGFVGNVLSLVLGSVSAGPIYAAFPIAKTLMNKGASIGNIVIILSAWAVVKVPMLANEAKFLGPSFMLVRWGITVVMIFIMGWIMEKVIKKSDLPLEVETIHVPLSINEDYCIACGLCAKIAPEAYEMKGNKALVKSYESNAGLIERIKETVTKCPVTAISYESEV